MCTFEYRFLWHPDESIPSPEPELQVAVYCCLTKVQGTKFMFSKGAASTLTAEPSLDPLNFVFETGLS